MDETIPGRVVTGYLYQTITEVFLGKYNTLLSITKITINKIGRVTTQTLVVRRYTGYSYIFQQDRVFVDLL